MDPTVDRLRLLGFTGSNKLLAGELARLGKRAFPREEADRLFERPPQKLGLGAVAYPFSPELATLAVHYHRTSARALWDLYESDADRLEPLYANLFEAIASDERPYAFDGARFSVVAFGTESVAAGERQVVGTVKNALVEGFAQRGLRLELDPEQPELLFHVRSRASRDDGAKDLLTVSLDLAGRPLHQRGYRTLSGEAPLREDLAAALVLLGRHDPRREFVLDPMAGAGTLLVEASHMALGRPLWTSGRSPAAAHHPHLRGASEQWGRPLFPGNPPPLYAAEVDPETQPILERTLETAGVHLKTQVFPGDFRDWDPAEIREHARSEGYETGLLLSNPPYGVRLHYSERELFALYRDLGAFARRFSGCRAGFLIGEPDEPLEMPRAHLFQKAFGGRPRVTKPLRNGPLRALFLLYDL